VNKLEQGDIPLEESIKMYEEGLALSKACVEKLTQAELRLKKLSKDIDGSFHFLEEESK
jgi:exodeoxyribonuclease VII small subunit